MTNILWKHIVYCALSHKRDIYCLMWPSPVGCMFYNGAIDCSINLL